MAPTLMWALYVEFKMLTSNQLLRAFQRAGGEQYPRQDSRAF